MVDGVDLPIQRAPATEEVGIADVRNDMGCRGILSELDHTPRLFRRTAIPPNRHPTEPPLSRMAIEPYRC
jgi:hypothetical protein